jgi:hypothetical protein
MLTIDGLVYGLLTIKYHWMVSMRIIGDYDGWIMLFFAYIAMLKNLLTN